MFRGDFPADLPLDAAIESLGGYFAYPVRYGYALAGKVLRVGSGADAAWLGRRVLALHPHQNYACVKLEQCWRVPDDVPLRAACFLPNMESAVNFVMDARPGLGERFLVLGQGVVGLLTTAILARFPLAELAATDRLAARLDWAGRFGANPLGALDHLAADGARAGAGFDAVLELSGDMAALNEAIAVTGFGGRIVIGSWYGGKAATLDLGGVFHRRRLILVSSQVSTLAADLSARWNKGRRLALAWDWLRRIGPERLITDVFPPERCQEAFELAARPAAGTLQVMFQY